MSRLISGFIRLFQASGTCTAPTPPRVLYAVPSHHNAMFQCGGRWTPLWTNDTITDPLYKRSVKAETDADGRFQFNLPSSPTETFQPQGQTVTWTILDPTTQLAYMGEVKDAIPVSGGADMKVLIASYGWQILPTNQMAIGAANFRAGVLEFTDADLLEKVVDLVPPLPSSNYSIGVSGGVDDLNELNYEAYVKAGWSASSFTVRISSPVPAARVVKVPWTALG